MDKDCAPKFTFGGIIILIGVFFFSLNSLYPIYLDDWHYSFSLVGQEKISSLPDILIGQYAHYFDWGGRSVLHTIAQILLWIGEPWNNFINAIAYIILTLIIYFIANKGNKTNSVLFIYINIFVWFTLPALSQNLLWITGSANYLWGGLLVFSLLYYYTSFYLKNEEKSSNLKTAGVLILGILAGWTNENTSIALIFFILGLLILLKIQKKKIPAWMITGLIGTIIGCLIMILAPGNAIRSKNDLWVAHQLRETDISFYFYRFVTVTKLAFKHLLIPSCIYLILVIAYWIKSKKELKKEKLYLSVLFFSTSVVATIVMSGSPMFPERAWFGILLFLITGAAILYSNIDFSTKKYKIINYSAFSIILIIYLFSCTENYVELSKFSEICNQREKAIKAEKEKGVMDIVVEDYEFKIKESPLIVLDLQDWMMIDPGWSGRLGKFYGVSSVTFNKREE